MSTCKKFQRNILDFLSPQNNKVYSERDSQKECFVPLSLTKKHEISEIFKDQKLLSQLSNIQIDLFKLKNDEDFNSIDMNYLKKSSARMPLPLPSLLVSGSICPQIKKHNKNTNKTQSFSQTQYTNNYEKYFPTFSSNISIPNGENAHYISKNINKNNEFFSIKPLMTSPHSQVHSEMLSNNLNSTLSIEKLDHVENKFNKVSHSDNLYIKKSSLEQNFELLQKFKDVHGLNSIKPALKEKYRNQELLKVTRSLLIANDSMTKHLKSTNKRILGIETQDLIHYSKYADPNMIKTSIKTDNDNNYPQIQRHFGLEGKFKDEDYENKRFMATKGEWSKVGERKIGSDEVLGLQGHKIKTNFSEGTIKFKEFKVAKMEKIKKNSIKQVNFKKNQQSLTPIAFINKKKEKIEQN